MHSPTNRFAHRHRPAAAGTDITLVGVRIGRFTCSKIAINDLIVGVARQAATDCAFGTDDLFTFACDQHAGVLAARSAPGEGTLHQICERLLDRRDRAYLPIELVFVRPTSHQRRRA